MVPLLFKISAKNVGDFYDVIKCNGTLELEIVKSCQFSSLTFCVASLKSFSLGRTSCDMVGIVTYDTDSSSFHFSRSSDFALA